MSIVNEVQSKKISIEKSGWHSHDHKNYGSRSAMVSNEAERTHNQLRAPELSAIQTISRFF